MNADPVTWSMALLAGLLGSGHCLAMCGGIACLPAASGQNNPWRLLLFNLGRVLSYGVLGAIVAGAGTAILGLFSGPLAPDVLRLAAAMMVAVVALHLLWPARFGVPGQRLGRWVWRRMAGWVAPLIRSNSPVALFALGAVWGWLPCGLVYAMLGASALTGSSVQGAVTMVAFGVGTLPALMITGAAGQALLQQLRGRHTRVWAGAALLLAAGWMAWMPLGHLLDSQSAGHMHHHSGPHSD